MSRDCGRRVSEAPPPTLATANGYNVCVSASNLEVSNGSCRHSPPRCAQGRGSVAGRAGAPFGHRQVDGLANRVRPAQPVDRKARPPSSSNGRRVGVYPTSHSGSIEAGDAIAEWRADGDSEAAVRYSDNLAATEGVDRVVLAAAEPPPTGSAVWDAALAAVTEHWLDHDALTKPGWIDDPARTLPEETPLTVNRWTSTRAIRDVPPAFRRRRILVDESTLQRA